MASITFFLKQPYLDRPTPIIARVAVGGKKIKVYTGLFIQPKKWIQAAQLVATRSNTQAGHLNATLQAESYQFSRAPTCCHRCDRHEQVRCFIKAQPLC